MGGGPNFESWYKGAPVLQIGDTRQFDYWIKNAVVVQMEISAAAADTRLRPAPIFND